MLTIKCAFIAGNLFMISPDGERAANLSTAQTVRGEDGYARVFGANTIEEFPIPAGMTTEQVLHLCERIATEQVEQDLGF